MAAGMIHIGLFDGIGGFGMAAAWCGIETVVSCEIGAFGSDVLASPCSPPPIIIKTFVH